MSFFENHRYYEVGGRKLPSVTTVLSVVSKPALGPWMAKMEREAAADLYIARMDENAPLDPPFDPSESHRDAFLRTLKAKKAAAEKSKEATDIGKLVHKAVEHYIKGLPVELPAEGAAQNAFRSFLAWHQCVEIENARSEVLLVNEEDGYAGTADLVAEVNGKVTVLDFKTSKAFYPEMDLQLAAYARAWELGNGRPMDQGLIVRLPKEDGDAFETKTIADIHNESLYGAFKGALALFRYLNPDFGTKRR